MHRDRTGRRLVGLPGDPKDSCTLVCTAAGAFRPPVLNGQAQRGTEVFRDGVFAGADTYATARSVHLSAGADEDADDPDAAYFAESAAGDGFSAFGASSIFGTNEAEGVNLGADGADFRSGDPQTAAPLSGRLSRGGRDATVARRW